AFTRSPATARRAGGRPSGGRPGLRFGVHVERRETVDARAVLQPAVRGTPLDALALHELREQVPLTAVVQERHAVPAGVRDALDVDDDHGARALRLVEPAVEP